MMEIHRGRSEDSHIQECQLSETTRGAVAQQVRSIDEGDIAKVSRPEKGSAAAAVCISVPLCVTGRKVGGRCRGEWYTECRS